MTKRNWAKYIAKKQKRTKLQKRIQVGRLITSKKKRIIKKHCNASMQTTVLTATKPLVAVATISSSDIKKLPVTMLLKLGKKFYSNEEAVKYYYNNKYENVYKNRALLEETISANVHTLPMSEQVELQEEVKSYLEKKAKTA
ncbi:MAG: hypothetical protein ACI35O_03740 [Bacillaceae bacterium]